MENPWHHRTQRQRHNVTVKVHLRLAAPQRRNRTGFRQTIGKDCVFAPDTGLLIEPPGLLTHETGLHSLLILDEPMNGLDKSGAGKDHWICSRCRFAGKNYQMGLTNGGNRV